MEKKKVVVALPLAAGVIAFLGAAISLAAAVVARIVVVPTGRKQDDVRVIATSPELSTVSLSNTAETRVPGKYSFWFSQQSGHLKLGQIIEVQRKSVVRHIDQTDFGDVKCAKSGWVSGWFYLMPEELGLSVAAVDIHTDSGVAPAWIFPGEDRSRWAIHVHGRGTQRQETLRGVPVFHRRGYTNLIVSYRNDGDAPGSTDRRYGLGLTEWRDIDAAIDYARDQGANEILLVGWSMGGAIVLQTATRSVHSDIIRGIVLDSPVINWTNTLEHQAKSMRLPGFITRIAFSIVRSPWGRYVTGQGAPIDFEALNFVDRADILTAPILLMHSEEDDYVPPDASRELAKKRPDIVTYVEFSRARHTKLWNFDDRKWEVAVDQWLEKF